MAEDSSNHDEGFGLPPAPTIAPEFSAEWLDVEHPKSLSAVQAVILSRLHFIAAQNQHIMALLENLRITNSRSKSPHNSISSAAASTEGGDDTNIPSVTGDRKKKRDNPQGKGKAKVKNSSSPVSAPTDDSRSGSSRVKGEQSQ